MKNAAATTERAALPRSRSLPTFFDNLDSFAEAPQGVAKLRELILDLAVRGKLVEQDENHESVSELRARVDQQRNRLVEEKKIRAPKLFDPVESEEQPFALPCGWDWLRLGELADWAIGSGFPKRVQGHTDKPILFCKVSDMNLPGNEKHLLTAQNTIDDDIARDVRAKIHPAGTVVFPKIGGAIATNKRRIVTKPTAIDNNCLGLTTFGLCEVEWLYVLLTSIDLTEYQSGTSVPALSQGTLETIVIGVPPLSEQRRIVSKVDGLLSLCDELESRGSERVRLRERASRSCLDRLVVSSSANDLSSAWQRLSDHFEVLYDTPETLAHLRQSILQLAVQGKLVPQDPNDEPAAELIAEIHARKNELVDSKEIPKPKKLPPIDPSKLPFEVPAGWEWLRLESVCEVITKGSSPKWQGVSYLESSEGGIMFITSENVGNYVMRKMDAPKFVEAKFNEMEPRSILQRDDILVNLVGASIGRSAIWNRDDVANINQAVGIVRLVPGCRSLNRRYLLNYLNSPTCLAIMFENQVVTAQPNISLTNVKHFLVPLPPLAEQKRIVAKMDQLLSQCDELSARLRERQSATQQLLTATIHHVLNGVNG